MENLWSVRRARAVHLLGQTPHAEEILTFYKGLAEVQERVADQVPAEDWMGLVRSEEGALPWLRVENLPLDQLTLPFHEFLSSVAGFGTERIRDGAQTLLSQDEDRRLEPLRAALGAWGKTAALEEQEEEEGEEEERGKKRKERKEGKREGKGGKKGEEEGEKEEKKGKRGGEKGRK